MQKIIASTEERSSLLGRTKKEDHFLRFGIVVSRMNGLQNVGQTGNRATRRIAHLFTEAQMEKKYYFERKKIIGDLDGPTIKKLEKEHGKLVAATIPNIGTVFTDNHITNIKKVLEGSK